MNDREPGAYELIMKAGGFLLVLLMVLAIITSLKTGISLFDPQIMQMLSTVFIISLVILGILIGGMIVAAIALSGKSSPGNKSMLIKDNALRYEIRDGRRKYKKTFELTNIDDYLRTYKEMYVIENIRLYKADPNKKCNAINIMAELPDGRKLSLRDINNEDSDLYNRLAAFLDMIHEKDEIALSFHLRTYVNKESIVHAGEKAVDDLNRLKKMIADKEICEQITYTCDNINQAKAKVMAAEYSDKLRKLYDNYLGMLVEIVDNYETLERHKVEPTELAKAKRKLLETFDLINKAIDTLDQDEPGKEYESLEADSNDLDNILKKETVQVKADGQ